MNFSCNPLTHPKVKACLRCIFNFHIYITLKDLTQILSTIAGIYIYVYIFLNFSPPPVPCHLDGKQLIFCLQVYGLFNHVSQQLYFYKSWVFYTIKFLASPPPNSQTLSKGSRNFTIHSGRSFLAHHYIKSDSFHAEVTALT